MIAQSTISNVNLLSTWIVPLLEDDEHFRMPILSDDWIDKYLDCDFHTLFRMRKHTFWSLLELVGQKYTIPKYRGGSNEPLQLEKMLMIFLWYLSKGNSMNTTADRFDVAVKSVHVAITKMLPVFEQLKYALIKWPTETECSQIEAEFKKTSKFPGIIGAMDGCHFKLKVNKVQHNSYQDRHFGHSITMQAICLPNMKYTNISTRYPGSLHDARVGIVGV